MPNMNTHDQKVKEDLAQVLSTCLCDPDLRLTGHIGDLIFFKSTHHKHSKN